MCLGTESDGMRLKSFNLILYRGKCTSLIHLQSWTEQSGKAGLNLEQSKIESLTE